MKITMYSPQKLYGFCEADTEKVFFHLENFRFGQGVGATQPPPPIIGESVVVTYTPTPGADIAPKAGTVHRIGTPVLHYGVVETFTDAKGWGFLKADDGQSFYLHRSEVEGNRLPLPGLRVMFFSGFRKGRPRACYVTILD